MAESVKKNKIGVVTRKSGEKSVIVEVKRTVQHPVFKKYLEKRRNFHVHDEGNACQLGDKVVIVETRPISKTKRWKVASVISHGILEEKGVEDTAVQKESV